MLGDADVVQQDRDALAVHDDIKPFPAPLVRRSIVDSIGQMQLRAKPWIRAFEQVRQGYRNARMIPIPNPSETAHDRVRHIPDGGGKPGTNVVVDDGSKQVSGMVTIEAYPPAVEIRVDGHLLGIGKINTAELKPGSHVLELHHPSCSVCEDRQVPFTVPAGVPAHIKERIGFKPAVLVVEAPATGQVFIDGVLVGRVGDSFTLQAATHRPWEVEVKVLFDDGRAPASVTAKVQAGTKAKARLP